MSLANLRYISIDSIIPASDSRLPILLISLSLHQRRFLSAWSDLARTAPRDETIIGTIPTCTSEILLVSWRISANLCLIHFFKTILNLFLQICLNIINLLLLLLLYLCPIDLFKTILNLFLQICPKIINLLLLPCLCPIHFFKTDLNLFLQMYSTSAIHYCCCYCSVCVPFTFSKLY
jgi:hypothetical protein